jgi:hypothetical protein
MDANPAGAGSRLPAYRALTHHGLGMACEFRRFHTTRHRDQRLGHSTKGLRPPYRKWNGMHHAPLRRSHQHRISACRAGPNATDDIPEPLAELRSVSRQKLVVRRKDGNVVYTYCDPDACRHGCAARPNEYSPYEDLIVNGGRESPCIAETTPGAVAYRVAVFCDGIPVEGRWRKLRPPDVAARGVARVVRDRGRGNALPPGDAAVLSERTTALDESPLRQVGLDDAVLCSAQDVPLLLLNRQSVVGTASGDSRSESSRGCKGAGD